MQIKTDWGKRDLLALSLVSGFSSDLKRKYVESFESFGHFYTELSSGNSLFPNKHETKSSDGSDILDEAEQQLEIAEKFDSGIISFWDESYPDLLRNITYPPVVLYCRGKMNYNRQSSISVVGTRRCTQYGRLQAEKFAGDFAANNIIVTSGLAYGIDTYSHIAAINSKGTTCAVIASGIDCISPSTSLQNAHRIIDSGGAIISEYKFGTKARPGYFPQRNRIISGVSVATIVIESALKGGAMITARFAFEQSREVFAIPGNVTSAKSEGTNHLIKSNIAALAMSPKSVLEDLGIQNELFKKEKKLIFEDKVEEKIFELISGEPCHVDTISNKTGIDIPELLVRLLNMEFNSLIRQLPGKYYIKA